MFILNITNGNITIVQGYTDIIFTCNDNGSPLTNTALTLDGK